MTTYADIATRTGTAIPEHLIAQAEIPVLPRVIQGDVMITPHQPAPGQYRPAHDVPPEGINVVQGDIGRNRHILSPGLDSTITWTPGIVADPDRDYGLLTVIHGIAVLTHSAEHGSVAVPEGTYRVLGQFDPQTRARVAD
jgi:hypothetical protein